MHPDPERFKEDFIDTGHVDMYQTVKIYYEAGYYGFFIDDHGYIQAMLEAVTKQGADL